MRLNSLNGEQGPIIADGLNGELAPIIAIAINDKPLPIVVNNHNDKSARIEMANCLPSFDEISDAETADLPAEIDPPTRKIGPLVKTAQSSGIKLKIKNPEKVLSPAKRPNSPKKGRPKKPRTAHQIASPLLDPKVRRKSLETRRRNAQIKKQNAARLKKERGERAIAKGGRVTKTGRIYEAESLQHKKDAMSAVTLQRLDDEVSAGLCVARNLIARATPDNPDGIDLKHDDEYRSLTEDLLAAFLEKHKAALQYTALYYPERDYPHDCHDWSVTPSGQTIPWVRDFDILFRFDGEEDIWFQFQGKGQNLWFQQLRSALQHKIKATSSRSLYLGVRALFDLVLRHETHKLARFYFNGSPSIIRPIRYVSYTSVKHWIRQDYHLTGEQCLDLLERESSRFIAYCYHFFKAVWPDEMNLIAITYRRLKGHIDDHNFEIPLTTPFDPLLLTPKEVAAEYGAYVRLCPAEENISKKPNYFYRTNG
jgi:hypothetical protein